MEHILEKLFESVPKARILRIFLRNPDENFTMPELVKRSGLRETQARKELAKLLKFGLLKSKFAQRVYELPPSENTLKKKRKIIKKERVYFVNFGFPVITELKNLVTKSSVTSHQKLLQKIKLLGKIKLAVISGILINNDHTRTDLLIVGDHIKKTKFNSLLEILESELGKSIRYTLMDSKEFKYRMDMYDRFLRDILEYPHEKLIDRTRS